MQTVGTEMWSFIEYICRDAEELCREMLILIEYDMLNTQFFGRTDRTTQATNKDKPRLKNNKQKNR